MISKETGNKILAFIRKTGIVKLTVFALATILEYQALIILNGIGRDNAYTPAEHSIMILVTTNLIMICLMWFAYMYDHIIDTYYEVFV